ncbi:c-type cytochrome [soil metagenome]
MTGTDAADAPPPVAPPPVAPRPVAATVRLARRAIVVVVLITVGLTVVVTGRSPAGAQDDLVAEGRDLYLVGCVSCHGAAGEGVVADDGSVRGPPVTGAGEAGAFYWVATGRMPLNDPDGQPMRGRSAYEPEEIDALVAYVASLGEGPALPELSLEGADLGAGGTSFRRNCQACHSASGAGGALSYGRAAPPLDEAEPAEVAAAMRAGPGQMPVFGTAELGDDELANVVAYVEYLREPDDPGGLPLGRIGPVPEGFIAWSVGITAMLACVVWIGTRSPIRRKGS